MKKALIIAAAATAVLATAVSCKKGSTGTTMEAVVTVKDNSGSCYFQLDDNTILLPKSTITSPYDEQTRALLLYVDYGTADPLFVGSKARSIDVARIDKILTKAPVESLGPVQDPIKYGSDPMDIINTWMTVVEDGYITLCFRSLWGVSGNPHVLNLVKNADSSDPYCFVLRQSYNGDVPTGILRYGTVAFDISDMLTDHEKTYEISVRHIGIDGVERTAKFSYKYGQSAVIANDSDKASDVTLNADIK